jgi:hypothetical protein
VNDAEIAEVRLEGQPNVVETGCDGSARKRRGEEQDHAKHRNHCLSVNHDQT